MTKREYLLTDAEVAGFLANGYHIMEPELPEGLNEIIGQQLDSLDSNPGDAIVETVPELRQVIDHPAVRGVLISLLGKDYKVQSHRHWHCRSPGMGSMKWHQDGQNRRDIGINRFLGLYYPRDVTADMGPTVIVPGTQFRNAPSDRMATYGNIRGQVPLVVKAGTVAFTHYDIWHGTAANTSGAKRHMIKFLFHRTSENTEPTWDHDPEGLDKPRDWNLKGNSKSAGDILTFANPLNVAQSDHYKDRAIRRKCWKLLLGETADKV